MKLETEQHAIIWPDNLKTAMILNKPFISIQEPWLMEMRYVYARFDDVEMCISLIIAYFF